MGTFAMSEVAEMAAGLQELLDRVRRIKRTDDVQHALDKSDLVDLVKGVQGFSFFQPGQQPDKDALRQRYFAKIETAARSFFNSLLSSTSIDQAEFARIWDLLDVVSILSDMEQCEPGLVFWLIEELLDSQTIQGCKKVFDYLESRRERLTAKHFKQKNLVILRSCNELLRRLSRAENAVFCGRVFIFLFQSFPLGDKSSVNLRGEFHVENVTSFEDAEPPAPNAGEKMDVDQNEQKTEVAVSSDPSGLQLGGDSTASTITSSPSAGAGPTNGAHATTGQADTKKHVDYDRLYPVFWSLQEHFSNPPRLFDANNLQNLKDGLERTLNSFKAILKATNNQTSLRLLDEGKRGTKRKLGDGGDYMASNFNPKYLTSRDLFELEVSDLAFRRHILVQALILLDFLFSLTRKEKAKWSELTPPNKSVQYAYTLSDEDANWVAETKNEIASYLQQGLEGKFYYRMVDTVLSRDKNWVRWKAESCPTIEKAAVSAKEWEEAKDGVRKASVVRPMRDVPLGSLDLSFLSDIDPARALKKLKSSNRYGVPEIESLQESIAEADDKILHPKDDAEKEAAAEERSSRIWRVLRLGAKDRLARFDKLGTDVKSVQILYRDERLDAGKPAEDGDETNSSPRLNGERNEMGAADEATFGLTQPPSNSPAVEDTAVQ